MDTVSVRRTRESDIPGIIELCREIYPFAEPWNEKALKSHQALFPDGQLVAVQGPDEKVVGMAASLVISWDDYDIDMSWGDFTGGGMFTNHDPKGRTLYGAEVMVSRQCQGCGIGKKIYAARRDIVHRHKLLRIRAGARLPGYQAFASQMSAREYVVNVITGRIGDPTLSFQLKQGFRVIGVVQKYLSSDPQSRGAAAVIEWLNPDVASPIGEPLEVLRGDEEVG